MAHVHPIPFPPAPVPHQPSPLSFGFAFPCGTHGFGSTSSPSAPPAAGPSSTFGSPLRRPQPQTAFSSPSFPVNGQVSPSVGFGFGSPAAGGSTSRPTAQFQRHSSTGSPTVNRRRGRDDLSDEDEDEQDQRDQREFERARPMRGMKKSKVDPFGTVPSSSATSGPSVASTPSSSSSQASNEEPDLGVLLALLPPNSLLPILTSLVQRHPTLKPDLLALLPQPSLPVALEGLRAAENKVLSAVPFGWDAQRPGGGVSEHYVVGRVTESANDLVALIQSHLPIFLPTANASSSTPSRPPPHPTDQFSYLQHATSLLLRLCATLPPLPALSVLWSRLAREWVGWANLVSRWVNSEGGMVGNGVAEGWMRELDGLVGGSKGVEGEERRVRSEMGQVRDRWVRECGWLVGRRAVGLQHDVGMMEEEL